MLNAHIDFTDRHVHGRELAEAKHGADVFSQIPALSEVDDNLWFGGHVKGHGLPETVSAVVSVHPTGWHEKYATARGTRRLTYAICDHEFMISEPLLRQIAEDVNQLRAAGVTVVHCETGLNTSALVCAFALILAGAQPADAVAKLRACRSEAVLCNPTFESWLLSA